MKTKKCSRCEEVKPITAFGFRNDRPKNPYRGTCKLCKTKERNLKNHGDENYQRPPKKTKKELQEYGRRWYAESKKDPEFKKKRNENWARWKKNNPEKFLAWKLRNSKTLSAKVIRARVRHKKRKINKNLINDITEEDIKFLLEYQDKKCACCRKIFKNSFDQTQDHIIPPTQQKPEGLGLSLLNVQLLCRKCNSRKLQKVIDYRPLVGNWEVELLQYLKIIKIGRQ